MFVLSKALVILVNLLLAFLRYRCKMLDAITVLPFIVLQAWFPYPICGRPYSDFWQ